MPDFTDELADTDFGQDFEDFAVGLKTVTIKQIDPDDGSTLATATVKATKLPRRRSRFQVSGGELGDDTGRFVFRADQLTFTPKSRDQIIDADGLAWEIERAEIQGFDAICSADVVKKRS